MTLNPLIVVTIALAIHASPVTASASVRGPLTADTFFTQGHWDAAITEYKRYLFLNPSSPHRDHCYGRISRCYRELKEWDHALETTRRAIALAETDSVRCERRLDAGEILLSMGLRPAAELEFFLAQRCTLHPEIYQRATIHLAMTQLEAFRWPEAQKSLLPLRESVSGPQWVRIDSLFDRMESADLKSPKTARRLSTVIPGAGQFYAGKWLDGFHSLALNTACGALLIHSIRERRVALAVFSTMLFTRYYRGSRHHAARFARERNMEILRSRTDDTVNELRRNWQ
ncbi:MAG: tetratricopeptide repeat protein [Candidatus Latescibacterota bacterium]|nr:MAG: tetratricopeptide repeat protein [Candidatus Latescibacterota bacterium]